MTCRERVYAALENPCFSGGDCLNKLLALAYYMGRESKAVECSDRLAELLARMRERASQCHFHRLANHIIDDKALFTEVTENGKREYLYDSDYSGWITSDVGSDVTNL